MEDATNTLVGGLTAGAGNVVAGTQISLTTYTPAGMNGVGIYVEFDGSGTVVEGNRVGTNESGTAAIPNAGPGILVELQSAVVSDNLVSGNTGAGISVYGDAVLPGFAGLWSAEGTTDDGFAHNGSIDGVLVGGAGYAPGLSGQAFSFDGVSGAYDDANFSNRLTYGLTSAAGHLAGGLGQHDRH